MGVTISDVKWNTSIPQIIKDKILGKDTMTFAASEAKRIMSPFVPMDTGTLADTAQIIADDTTATVHYVQPYAAVVYYGERKGRKINIRKERHPLASKQWDIAAMDAGGKDKLIKALQNFILRKK